MSQGTTSGRADKLFFLGLGAGFAGGTKALLSFSAASSDVPRTQAEIWASALPIVDFAKGAEALAHNIAVFGTTGTGC